MYVISSKREDRAIIIFFYFDIENRAVLKFPHNEPGSSKMLKIKCQTLPFYFTAISLNVHIQVCFVLTDYLCAINDRACSLAMPLFH